MTEIMAKSLENVKKYKIFFICVTEICLILFSIVFTIFIFYNSVIITSPSRRESFLGINRI